MVGVRRRRDAPRNMRGAGHVVGALQRLGQCPHGHLVVQSGQDQGPARLWCRQHLEGQVGEGAQGAEGPGHQLADVVAGDVLHDPAAGLEGLAAPAYRVQTQQMVAGSARFDTARARQIAGEYTADRRSAGGLAKQRPQIRRFEGELLVGCRQGRLDFRQRRARLRRHHQLFGFVQADSGEVGQVEPMIGLERAAKRPLAPSADNLEWHLVRRRPAHGIEDLLRR